MKLFDLHCDTLSILENKESAVNLEIMRENEITRVFAIFTPDELKVKAAVEHFDKLYKKYLKIKDKVSAILSVENASVLNGEIKNIEKLSECGVKIASFTWNGENELGYGQSINRGLKAFGKECIPVFEEHNITIDVSHISDKGFEDIAKLSTKPFIATHSNSRKICNHKRNLTDEQILEIIKRKGLIGINFYKEFLNKENASYKDILKHAEHILALGGENVLAIGTDFDGAEIIEEFDNDKKLLGLEKLFLQNGFSKQITDKILFKNANEFFKDV